MKLWLNASCKYPNMIMPPQLHHHLHLSMTWNPTGHIPRRRRVDLTLVLNLDTWRRNRCNNFGRRCLLRRDYINFNCAKYVGYCGIFFQGSGTSLAEFVGSMHYYNDGNYHHHQPENTLNSITGIVFFRKNLCLDQSWLFTQKVKDLANIVRALLAIFQNATRSHPLVGCQ